MRAAGIQSVELAVEHVGEPGQRVPVADGAISQRPAKSLPSQTLLDNWIRIDIDGVVVVDKVESQRLAEDHPDNSR